MHFERIRCRCNKNVMKLPWWKRSTVFLSLQILCQKDAPCLHFKSIHPLHHISHPEIRARLWDQACQSRYRHIVFYGCLGGIGFRRLHYLDGLKAAEPPPGLPRRTQKADQSLQLRRRSICRDALDIARARGRGGREETDRNHGAL